MRLDSGESEKRLHGNCDRLFYLLPRVNLTTEITAAVLHEKPISLLYSRTSTGHVVHIPADGAPRLLHSIQWTATRTIVCQQSPSSKAHLKQ